jgi:hypothetical protein
MGAYAGGVIRGGALYGGMMEVTTSDVDLGLTAVKVALEGVGRQLVAVGVLGANGSQDDGGGITLAGIATVHEFGAEIDHPGGTPYKVVKGRAVFLKKGAPDATGVTGPHKIRIPERSFIRRTLREQGPKLAQVATTLGTQMAMGLRTEEQALKVMGEVMATEIKKTITGRVPPPLSAATVRRKKSTVPLIDTGRLRASITAEVRTVQEDSNEG